MVFHITHKLQDLCSRLQSHSHRVRLLDKIKRFRGRDGQTEISHLEKLCYSLQHFLKETGLSSVECRRLLDQIKDILIHCLQLEVI